MLGSGEDSTKWERGGGEGGGRGKFRGFGVDVGGGIWGKLIRKMKIYCWN